jgi:hypothetical protein
MYDHASSIGQNRVAVGIEGSHIAAVQWRQRQDTRTAHGFIGHLHIPCSGIPPYTIRNLATHERYVHVHCTEWMLGRLRHSDRLKSYTIDSSLSHSTTLSHSLWAFELNTPKRPCFGMKKYHCQLRERKKEMRHENLQMSITHMLNIIFFDLPGDLYF